MTTGLVNTHIDWSIANLGQSDENVPGTVVLQWLEHLWNHENMFETAPGQMAQ